MLKSVRVYFNTKRMSAILKALQNRKVEVELKSEVVEFAIGDELRGLASKTATLRVNTDKELNSAFTPIRELQKAISKLTAEIPSKINSFNDFSKSLQKMEQQYASDKKKIEQAEKDLGVKIPQPKAMKAAIDALVKFQKEEEDLRKDINEFNTLAKKFKAMR